MVFTSGIHYTAFPGKKRVFYVKTGFPKQVSYRGTYFR